MRPKGVQTDPAIVNRLVRFRKQFIDKSRPSAAEKLKMVASSLYRYESGETALPAKFINQLQKEFKLNTEWLFKGVGKETIDAKPRTTLTDLQELRDVIDKLTTQVQVLLANQKKLWEVVEGQQKEIENLNKSLEMHTKK